MSNCETDSQVSGDGEGSKDNICRDFLRNVCHRGTRCRFRHPDSDEAKALGKKEVVDFCHDFQNKECFRPNCKFIHCSKQDEEYFRSTGRLPDHVMKNISSSKNPVDFNRGIPICKDYFKGECRRSGRCKFRHISFSDYERECMQQGNADDRYDDYGRMEPQAKRRAYDDNHMPVWNERRQIMPQYCQMLEEENKMLIHKVDDLKKQVADLTATNEFLLDQNAQLRVSKQTLVSPISQQLIPHTLTPTLASIPAPSIAQLSQLPLSSELAPDLAPMVPVSISQRIAPDSMASSQVTSLSQSLPHTLPHTLMTSTALISYPIMTQSLRPVIPQSLGH